MVPARGATVAAGRGDRHARRTRDAIATRVRDSTWPAACSKTVGHSGNPRGRLAPGAAASLYGRQLPARLLPRRSLLSPAMRWLVPLVVFVACSRGAPDAAPPQSPSRQPPLALEHDFGVIPHGESREHEFALDLARLPERWVPLRVHLECSCGHAELRIRATDGTERVVDHSGSAANIPGNSERLVLHVVLDTKLREAIDLPPTSSRGYVTLQLATDITGVTRIQWPFVLKFGIDAPVELRPVATLDFGRVALSRRGSVTTTLRGDQRHANATFGPVTSSDPAVTVELEPADDHWLVRAACTPHHARSDRATVSIATSIPGYTLQLAAVWKGVPDLEATPLAKVSLRADLTRAQRAEEAVGQFVLVTDHDTRRRPEFTVHRIVDDGGRDLGPSLEVTFEPIPEQPRQHRMHVRYLGGLSQRTRGSIVLTKNGNAGPFLPIEVAVFPTRSE
jgi:hypothetical protein